MTRTTFALLAVLALPTAALAGKPPEKGTVKVKKVDTEKLAKDFDKGMKDLSKSVKGASQAKTKAPAKK